MIEGVTVYIVIVVLAYVWWMVWTKKNIGFILFFVFSSFQLSQILETHWPKKKKSIKNRTEKGIPNPPSVLK